MAYEQRDNSGSAFINTRRTRDAQPHYTGSAKIDGKDYWVSLWIKEPKQAGSKRWFSFAFTEKGEGGAATKDGSPATPELTDDDIPF